MTTGPVTRWEPLADPAVRVFLFHHAGGSSMVYRGWAGEFPEDWETCLVDAPGRGHTQALPRIEDCAELVTHFRDALAPLLDRPFVLFGHSMGGLIAYELTRRLVAEQGPLPDLLGISAYGAPRGEAGADGTRHLFSDDELRDWLRRTGGCPPKLLDDDGVWSVFGPVFRSDFTLVDTWPPPRDPAPLPVPVAVFGGHQDTLVSTDRLRAWKTHTHDFRGPHLYDGGHFYLTDHRRAIAHRITSYVPTPPRTSSAGQPAAGA